MQDNIYDTPSSDLSVTDPNVLTEFHVVSLKKFTILFFFTLGIYSIYWFYRHWRCCKPRMQKKISPAGRSIFNIFYTHSLFKLIADSLKNKTGSPWHWQTLATLYVVCSLVSTVMDQVASKGIGSPFTDLISIAMLAPTWAALYSAQLRANAICDDPFGKGNSKLSNANIFFIILGVILWVLVFVGILTGFGLIFTELDIG